MQWVTTLWMVGIRATLPLRWTSRLNSAPLDWDLQLFVSTSRRPLGLDTKCNGEAGRGRRHFRRGWIMAGFREPEGPEIGSPPMSSAWPTACSRNTRMFCRMKRPRRSREAVCRCSESGFPIERGQSLNICSIHSTRRLAPSRMLNARLGCPLLALSGRPSRSRRHSVPAG